MSFDPKVEIVRDPTPCLELRRAVFVDEQGFDGDQEFDAHDESALHLLVRDGDRPIAAARLIDQGDTGRIGRICVAREHRGQGLGAVLVRFGIDHYAAQPGVSSVVLGAQVTAMPFYAKLGFVPDGEVYDDEGVPHQEMRRAV